MITRCMVTLTGHPRQQNRDVILKDGGRPIGVVSKSRRAGRMYWKLYGFNEKVHCNITRWEEGVARILIEMNGGR